MEYGQDAVLVAVLTDYVVATLSGDIPLWELCQGAVAALCCGPITFVLRHVCSVGVSPNT